MHPKLVKLRETLSLFEKRPRKQKSTENIFMSLTDAARATGIKRRSIKHWRAVDPDFPRTPFTRAQLMRHAERHKSRHDPVKIMEARMSGIGVMELARMFGTTKGVILNICNRALANYPDFLRNNSSTWLPTDASIVIGTFRTINAINRTNNLPVRKSGIWTSRPQISRPTLGSFSRTA
jgi:hypothetical protein